MVERVYQTNDSKVTVICPQCTKSKVVDVSRFARTNKTVKINSTCSCGQRWTSVLEKRKKYRKPVNLTGSFNFIKDEKVVDRGAMRVVDMSFDGVQIKLNVKRNFAAGDQLEIEFHLDDTKHTFIKKRVTVKNVSGTYVGTAFRASEPYDPALGFYLMADSRSSSDRRMNKNRRKGAYSSYSGPEKRAVKHRRNGEDRRRKD
jgi:hypothetical protein